MNRNVSYRTDHDDTLHALLDILFWDEELEQDNPDKEWDADTLAAIGEWVSTHRLTIDR